MKPTSAYIRRISLLYYNQELSIPILGESSFKSIVFHFIAIKRTKLVVVMYSGLSQQVSVKHLRRHCKTNLCHNQDGWFYFISVHRSKWVVVGLTSYGIRRTRRKKCAFWWFHWYFTTLNDGSAWCDISDFHEKKSFLERQTCRKRSSRQISRAWQVPVGRQFSTYIYLNGE